MKILIATSSSIELCPRAMRLIDAFSDNHEINVLSTSKNSSVNGQHFLLDKNLEAGKLRRAFALFSSNYESYLGRLFSIHDSVKKEHFDIVFCYDLILFPTLIKQVQSIKFLIDLREFYPKQFEDNFLWRYSFGRLYDYICQSYLSSADFLTTVSDGISNAYSKTYSVKPQVIYSFPNAQTLKPSKVDKSEIKLVHHGVSNSNRKIENLIKTMSYLPENYSLTLYIQNNNPRYYSYLCDEAKKVNNTKILPPISFEKICRTINQFDIGLFCPPKSTENLEYSMPNKIFEFVQARLALLVSPLTSVSEFVIDNKIGWVSKNHHPESLAKTIMSITAEEISKAKHMSDLAAPKFSFQSNYKLFQVWLSNTHKASKYG